MKASLFEEKAEVVEPIDEHKLAIADKKPEKVDAPRQEYYIVDYKTLVKPSLIALAIFVVWIVAEFLIV